jgi:hypothetical protein
MANENDEIIDGMSKLRDSFQGISRQAKDDAQGLDAFLAATGQGAAAVTKSLGSWAAGASNGKTSFQSLESVVDIASGALQAMAKAVPYAGKAAAAAIEATGEATKFMLKQMDQSIKAYNDLAKVGAVTAGGIKGMQQQFIASGMPLTSFTKIVGQNSVALARWRGVTGEGAEDFSDIVGRFTKQGDDSLRMLGMNAEQIGETTAAYLSQQTRLGTAQGKSNEKLAEGTRKYAIELDQLQKVTGLSRSEIQKQQDKALSESRFRANIQDMTDKGQGEVAERFVRLSTAMGDGELGKGIRDILGGANTKAAKALIASSGGAVTDIIDRMKSGQIDEKQAQIELQAATRKNMDSQRQYAKTADKNTSPFIDQAELSDFNNRNLAEGLDKAKTATNKQLEEQNDLTKDTVKAQKNIERMNIEIQELGFKFMDKAAPAVKNVAKSMADMFKWVNKQLGKQDDKRVDDALAASGSTMGGMDTGGGGTATANEAPPTSSGTPPGSDSKKTLADKIIQVESGGRNIANQSGAGGKATSSAFGIAQFTKGTFEGLAGKAGKENPLYGKTWDDYKSDTDLQREALNQLMDTNRQYLEKQKVSTSDAAIYLAHFLGPNGAVKVLSQPDSTPLASVISPSQMEANPMLQKMSTVADIKSWADKKMGGGGFASAAAGAILSGPMGGYQPNSSMAGIDVKPLTPENLSNAMSGQSGNDTELYGLQLTQLDAMISTAREQLSYKEKLLNYRT